MMQCIRVLVMVAVLCVPSLPAWADLFQYTDRDGTVVIVDDESKIPAKYRKNPRLHVRQTAANAIPASWCGATR